MADLVPRADLARITRLLGAPYADTFGATETGNPPASAGLVPIGQAPDRLSKRQSVFCEVRLVDPDGRDVPVGAPGELWMRGPTLFSGYWDAPAANLAILGALQVGANGDLANYAVPGGRVPGIGGAMDLAVGARRVIVLMEHVAKDGADKLVHRCTFPLTAAGVVSRVITDLGVFDPVGDRFEVVERAG